MAEQSRDVPRPAALPPRSSHVAAPEARDRLPDARNGGLPPVIAFLARVGVAPSLLLTAMANRWRQGVSADAALLALPEVEADRFYRTLAGFLRVRFETGPVQFDSSVQWPMASRVGIAAVRTAGGEIAWLLAPRGASLEALVAAHCRDEIPRERILITSPARFSAMVAAARSETVRRRASHGLAAALGKDFSAMEGASAIQRIAAAAAFFSTVLALVLGGVDQTAISIIGGAVMSGAVLLRLFATVKSCELVERRPVPLADHQLPVYSVVVALYREASVVGQLIAALDALDYPRAKLDIKLVVEADDKETRAALQNLRLSANYEIIVAPPGVPRTKPRALNIGLDLARGALLVVFDAEDQPEPGQLRRAAETFATAPRQVACLQGRLAIDNIADSWLSHLFAVEYAVLFDVFNPGLAALGLPILLGGTSNHFRTEALRKVGGWDAWNVTEDADLGLRLARMGYDVEVLAESTYEEAPALLRAWMRQRRRWFKGWIQTFVTHSRKPRRFVSEVGLVRGLAAFSLLAGTLLGSLGGFAFALLLLHAILDDNLLAPSTPVEIAASTLWCFVCIIGLGSALLPAVIGARRRGIRLGWRWAFLLPVRYLLLSCAAWGGLYDFIRAPFYWAKTEHGLARTSRRKSGQRSEAL